MNPGDSTSRPLSAMYGLIVLFLGTIPLRMVLMDGLWYMSDSAISRGACVYQVFDDETCLGTVFTDRNSNLSEIVRTIGVSVKQPFDIDEKPIPCNCVVRLSGMRSAKVEKMSGHHLVCAGQRIDVNTADVKDLTALPGIGPGLAMRIVRYRDQHGPFDTVDELKGVLGLGKKRLAMIARLVEAKPVRYPPQASEHPDRVASALPSTRTPQMPGDVQP